MARQRPALQPPRPGDVTRVPSTGRRRPLWRACARHHPRPWWFSTRTDNLAAGRFDLESPRGTCYWALSPAAAIIEATSDPDQAVLPVVTLGALARLSLWHAVDVARARSRLADTTRPSVPTLTAEIATIVPYTLPWVWADAFDADGRHGVLYRARFAIEESVALFGPMGTADDMPAARRTSALEHIDELPPGYRVGLGTVGRLDELPRGPAP